MVDRPCSRSKDGKDNGRLQKPIIIEIPLAIGGYLSKDKELVPTGRPTI